MIIDLIITVLFIGAGCVVAIQLFDAFESETVRAFIVVGYGLFTLSMLLTWFAKYIDNLLST